jgi:tyrosine decarboxylase/aspartate 1-decarboxylase
MRFPEKGMPTGMVHRDLQRARGKDISFASGRIIGSMCTEPLPISKEAYARFIEANMGNSGLYPGTTDLELKVISMLRSLMHAPAGSGGRVFSGATESNISALWIARNASRRRKVVFAANAHFSIEKGCDLLGLEPVVIPLDGSYRMDVARVKGALDGACAIVATTGTTELGVVDPIREISNICGDVPIHIDAAFGGFVLPFLPNVPDFDFCVPSVTSMAIDHHKMGMSSMPAGSLVLRNAGQFRHIQSRSPYLTRQFQEGILGTRASSGIASAYAAMTTLGRKGYTKIVSDCMQVTNHLMDGMQEIGLEPVIRPVMNILSVRVKDPHKVYQTLLKKGWVASVTRVPSLRFVVMPHIKMKHAELLLRDMRTLKKRGLF